MNNDTIAILNWVDRANLSRSKKNLARDFSDGVLMAELLKYHFPTLVDVHNYITTSNSQQKKANWILLNKKVLNKLGHDISEDDIDNLINAKDNFIEKFLATMYTIVFSIIKNDGVVKNSIDNDNYKGNKIKVNSPNKLKASDLIGSNINSNNNNNDIINKTNKQLRECLSTIAEKNQEIKDMKLYIKKLENDNLLLKQIIEKNAKK